ncbi:reducing polyketide synthase FUB1 [Favolaschia claudopus]|uniref:Reducing polyketide synthase FUB1 n=1 Tax=Favolaschia claudopus TaxID=2862362 RepID=A0AAW0EDB5_9AGAR
MSVSTRRLIELSFLALLDSGIRYRGQRVGCYTSGIPFDILTVADPDEYEARGSFAGGPCMIANKISYHLDLLGPSIPTDTACSSSLTALHLAVQALRTGDCEAAVVGGCQLNHRFIDFLQYSQGGVLAPDGTCKPFDVSANGFSRGEGAVVIVVKLLEDALRDGDRIYALVLGTAVTTNGSAAPANAPVGDAQADAMRLAYKGTGRSPQEVDFIELHATGTAAGDPVEANWTGRAFKRDGPDGELLIGSVKGNIGHLEIAAFLASLSKICSIFSHGVIPPNVNMTHPNPAIEWERYKLRVPLEPTPLIPRHSSGIPLVSMMSSGIGGVNGHAVVEGPPTQAFWTPSEPVHTVPILLIAGGLSPRSAASISATLEEEVASSSDSDLALLSTIYGRRARQMTWRSFAIAFPDRSIVVPFSPPAHCQRVKQPIVFVFSGQGPQHLEMGRQLFQVLPVFRDCILRLDNVYRHRTGHSLLETTGLFANTGSLTEQLPIIWPIAITLPALTMVQVALCNLLQHIGVVPDIVIGHSAGETALLYACGAANEEMVMELSIARGQAMSLADEGAMAAVSCTAKEAEEIVEAVKDLMCGILEVACYNSADSVTLAGHNQLVERAVEVATARGLFARKLRTVVGVHSGLMDSCKDAYCQLVSEVFSRYSSTSEFKSRIPAFSALTGALYEDAFTADYFWMQTRSPVRFEQALASLLQHSPRAAFIEIGPHPVLSAYISAAAGDCPLLCPMRRFRTLSPHSEMQAYLQCVGQLVVSGHNTVEFNTLNAIERIPHRMRAIKHYPFQRKEISYYPEASAIVKRQMSSRNGPLNSPFLRISVQTHPTLSQHIIQGEPIMPAAGFLEMAFEFGAWTLSNISFVSMLPLPSEKVTAVDVVSEDLYWSVKSRPAGSKEQSARLHAEGYMSLERTSEAAPILNISDIKSRTSPFPMSKFYPALTYFAQYGPQFQRVETVWKGEDEALVEVRGLSGDLPDALDYVVHPAVLDACFHVMVHPAFTGNADRNTYYLPSRVQWVVRYQGCVPQRLPETVFAHATFKEWRPDCLVVDIVVADASGNYMCSLSGFEIAAHEVASKWSVDKRRFDLINQPYSISHLPLNAFSTPSPTVFHKFYQVYHHIVEHVGKRVVRVLDLGSDAALTTELLSVASMDSTSLCDYIVAHKSNANTVSYPAAVKFVELELNTVGNSVMDPSTFDIVLGPQLLLVDWPDATAVLAFAGRLLVPGGALILEHPDIVNHTLIPDDSFTSIVISQGSAVPILFAQKRALGFRDMILSRQQPFNSVVFELGRELDIQRRLAEMDAGQPLWIESSWDVHGAAAQGFSRSLRKELGHPVYLVIFAPNWDSSERRQMLHQLAQVADLEQELIIDSHRTILVPRLYPSTPPSSSPHLDNNNYWTQTGADSASYLSLPMLSNNQILVRIKSTYPLSQDLHVVAGEVVGTKSSCWMEGSHVSLLAGFSRINRGQIFDPSGVYLLLGGIGSLGLHIALWMYTRGAKRIVLTSRSGYQSLMRQKNVLALRILSYLRTRDELTLTLARCDASSVAETAECVSQIKAPIRGVMMLSVQLSDGIFSNHSDATYEVPFAAKTGALVALEKCLALAELDFLISISSATTFGNAGQTNYASANSTLDTMLREFRNAFSIVAPAIIDSSTIARTEDLLTDNRLAHWAPWAMSSKGKPIELEMIMIS